MRTLCYVASPSYSGSTLLTFLLGTHPRIATVGELKGRLYGSLQAPRHCSCTRRVTECAFWQRFASTLEAAGTPCDLRDIDTYFHAPGSRLADRLLRARVRGPLFEALRDAGIAVLPRARRELQRVLERNRAAAEAVCALQGGDVLLDSSKDAVRLKFLLASGLFRVKVLHLLRDGRGTANSFRKRDHLDVAAAARRWRTAHESFERLTARMPEGDVLRLRYEDLAARPEASLAGVLRFLELPEEGVRFDFRRVEQHVFGNPMRLDGSSEIRLDESWKSDLGPADLEAFEAEGGALNRRYGYAT